MFLFFSALDKNILRNVNMSHYDYIYIYFPLFFF